MKGKSIFNISFIAFSVMAVIVGSICYAKGRTVFFNGMDASFSMLIQVIPKMAAAFLLAGFIQVLVPRGLVIRWIGEQSGFKGILIASLAGMLTPGGPITSFPLIAALYKMGAGYGPLVAYLTSWEILGLQRLLIWEIPLMGMKFVSLRLMVSLLLPVIAGVTAKKLAHILEFYGPGGNKRP
ncbi:MAG: permease [Thermodesulfobacteriota bacterium]|nr:permease [Thermodesulfobacteriota bacterium]